VSRKSPNRTATVQEGSSRDSIAIAGGGLIGLSIAWRLAQQGWPVTILEKGSIGREASWAGAGMLAPGGEIEARSRLATLSLESRRLYGAFVKELEAGSGYRIDYQQCGSLDVAYWPDDLALLEARAARQAEIGILSKPLTIAQVRTFWPHVRSEGLAGARFYPEDAIVNPRELVAALASACLKLNVHIVEHSAVTGATVTMDAVHVETISGAHSCGALVVAAGAWSDSIAIDGTLPIPAAEPVKGHLIGYHQPEQTCSTIIRHGSVYLLQRANGMLIAGASVEHVGFNRGIDPRIVSDLAAAAGFVLPHLHETTPSETWIGFRPGSDDLHLGAWDSKRLYLAYGHYRNGILLAPVTAQNLADEISANLQTR